MIEGSDVYDFFSCMYKVYNKHNRDRKLMIPFSEFTKSIMELGRKHEKEMASQLKTERPSYSFSDFDAGFKETEKLMKDGAENIYQGLLMDKEFLGIPDLMMKREGKSKFGTWHYIPADIKLSTRTKEEQIMQLLFYDMLLEKVQGVTGNTGVIILKNSSEVIDLSQHKKKFTEALRMIEKLSSGYDHGMHIDTTCRECPWRNVCIPLAQEQHDVSLVYGLSRPVHEKLIAEGIKTLEDLENAESEKLAEIQGITDESVKKWQTQANVLLTKKDRITKIQLPSTENHIALDIESAENGLTYLIGTFDGKKFKYFHSDTDEKKNVEDFVEYLMSLGSYTLYHYGSIEKTVFRRLFELYKIPEETAKEILSHMVDILTLVRRNAILPITYYNLKDVAKHFGYKWRSSDASGSNSMVWYQEWLNKKDKEMLKKIVEYNEDDVRATYLILEKLSA